MSDRVKALVKAARIIQGLPGCEEELQKEGLSTAAKVTAGIVGGTALAAGGYVGGRHVGFKKGKTKGEEAGRQAQFTEDKRRFGRAAKGIYTIGARHGAKMQRSRDVAALRQHFLKNLGGMGGAGGKQKNLTKLPNPPKSTSQGIARSMPKRAEDKMAVAVYDGWTHGRIETDQLQNLPPVDLEKIAAVTLNRMESGDERATILWRLLTQ